MPSTNKRKIGIVYDVTADPPVDSADIANINNNNPPDIVGNTTLSTKIHVAIHLLSAWVRKKHIDEAINLFTVWMRDKIHFTVAETQMLTKWLAFFHSLRLL